MFLNVLYVGLRNPTHCYSIFNCVPVITGVIDLLSISSICIKITPDLLKMFLLHIFNRKTVKSTNHGRFSIFVLLNHLSSWVSWVYFMLKLAHLSK